MYRASRGDATCVAARASAAAGAGPVGRRGLGVNGVGSLWRRGNGNTESLVEKYIRRMFDVVVSGGALIVLGPLLMAIALVIRVGMGSPVLFRQARGGLGGKPFTLLKFRTMSVATDAGGRPLPDTARVTPLGRFLRRTSLDELPQLWNVFRGDMSVVGPRPLVAEYLPLYSPGQARRHEVKPGITGWAQVNGRNAISWDQKFELDVWYVDHRSGGVDLRVLLLTVAKVFRGGGVDQSAQETMEPFRGSGVGGGWAGGESGGTADRA